MLHTKTNIADSEGIDSGNLATSASACNCSDDDESGLESNDECDGTCGGIGWGDRGNVACDKIVQREQAKPLTQERGKHGKLKKLKNKYRNQEDSERQVILKVWRRHAIRVCSTGNLLRRYWAQAEVKATANSCAPLQKRPKKERATLRQLQKKPGFLNPSRFPQSSSSSPACATAAAQAWRGLCTFWENVCSGVRVRNFARVATESSRCSSCGSWAAAGCSFTSYCNCRVTAAAKLQRRYPLRSAA